MAAVDEVLPLEEQATGDVRSLILSALLIITAVCEVSEPSLSSRISAGLAGRAALTLSEPPPKRSSSKASNSTTLSLLLVGVSSERVAETGFVSDKCLVMLLGHNSFTSAADSLLGLQKVSPSSLGLGRLLLSFTISILSMENSDSVTLPLLPPRKGFLSTSS